MTEPGKKYGAAFPYSNNGHTGYQIRWQEDVIGLLILDSWQHVQIGNRLDESFPKPRIDDQSVSTALLSRWSVLVG